MNHLIRKMAVIAAASILISASACKKSENPAPTPEQPEQTAPAAPTAKENADVDQNKENDGAKDPQFSQLSRDDFNHAAQRLNLPIFWIHEDTPSDTVSPEKIVTLNFYPSSDSAKWVDDKGQFTDSFRQAYALMVSVMKDPLLGANLNESEKTRRLKVAEELDQGAITGVITDFTKSSAQEKAFVTAMLKVGRLIDDLYARQTGIDKAIQKIDPDDILSMSMLRRNWGAEPQSPKMKSDKLCRALPNGQRIPVGIYPEEMQTDANFCTKLDAREDAKDLLSPFTVVVKQNDALKAVPYNLHFEPQMTAVSDALRTAASLLEGNEKEAALMKYLNAAADAFKSNKWDDADEAWAAMNSTNSAWYVRVAPDEVYWDPCSRKAGFHMTFAHINPDALAWQDKLTPLQQEMEDNLAIAAGEPYKARAVNFHLPDFIDIVTNSGDDRDAFGATIGQSLPNWGPVANEGRGRTVAMSNLYTDPDSLRDRQTLASSMFTDAELVYLKDAADAGLLSTIIHEASHNLGPAHEYTVNGKVDDDIFGGSMASLAEELKAQTAAMWYLPYLVQKGVIDQTMAEKTYTDSIYWTFGHISRGMTDAEGHIQPYSQLAAIQIGTLLDAGAMAWNPDIMAANGKDKGAFTISFDKLPDAIDTLMKHVAQMKASGNKDALIALQKKYTEAGSPVPFDIIRERMLRLPKTSFVYSVKLK